MEILGWIMSLVGGILTDVLKWGLSTPATEEKVDVQEGTAKPIDDSEYDGLYGSRVRMHLGGQETD